METLEISETWITDKNHRNTYIEQIHQAIKILENKLTEDDTICLTPEEIASALFCKYKQKHAYRSGGRKSRIKEIHHWIRSYYYDFPDVSLYELRKTALYILSDNYAKSTIYEAIRKYKERK